jgi:hypothetical protein
MKNQKYLFKLLFVITLLIITLCLGYLSISEKNKETINVGSDQSIIIESQKEATWKDILTLDITNTMMIQPKFRSGEEYNYKVWIMEKQEGLMQESLSYDSTIYIDSIEKINNTDYYVMRERNITKISQRYIKQKGGEWEYFEKNRSLGGCIIKISKEDGKIIPSFSYGTRCYLLEQITITPLYYIYFYLNDNSKFEIGGQLQDIVDITELNVVGMEKIENRKSFKMETTRKMKIDNIEKVVERGTYWIDVNKRIPLKIEIYEGNILMISMELSNMDSLD